MMTENFDGLNAPQFLDFSKDLNGDVDDNFFDNYQEPDHNHCNVEEIDTKSGGFSYKNIDSEEVMLAEYESYEYVEQDSHAFRRSVSTGDLLHLQRSLVTACLSDGNNGQPDCNLSQSTEKITKPDIKPINSHARSLSKESINRLAQPKRFGSDQNLHRPYVALAEAVKKFQNNTPQRFKIKPKLSVNQHTKLESTVPQSPHLLCTKRTRPVLVLSHEDQEQKEFEDAQKFKIKAHPVNEKMLRGPLKPRISVIKKPNTIPKPFKLTEIIHKPKEPEGEEFKFHAQSIPNFNKTPVTKPIAHRQVTKPQTPTVLLRKTRKEEIIEKYLDEERKAREFHARPVPKAIFQNTKVHNSAEKKELASSHNSQENISVEFRAKSATILYKKPFEPKKSEKPLVKINEFKLNTGQRAAERKVFEQILKEKEEILSSEKQRREQIRLLQEQEDINKFRKMAEVKAQPIRKYKEVIIQPSGKVTEPVSPKFYKKHSKPNSFDKENKDSNNMSS